MSRGLWLSRGVWLSRAGLVHGTRQSQQTYIYTHNTNSSGHSPRPAPPDQLKQVNSPGSTTHVYCLAFILVTYNCLHINETKTT